MKIVIGITGASGSVYALRLMWVLREAGHEIHTVVTEPGYSVLAHECDMSRKGFMDWTDVLYDNTDIGARIASGSAMMDAMVILPCSMHTAGSLANGLTGDLLTRAADVMMKEGRQLVIVPRETPMHAVHLENLATLAKLGANILPACPAFYHKPQTVEDMIDMMVGKVLDVMRIPHSLYQRWDGVKKKGGAPAPSAGAPTQTAPPTPVSAPYPSASLAADPLSEPLAPTPMTDTYAQTMTTVPLSSIASRANAAGGDGSTDSFRKKESIDVGLDTDFEATIAARLAELERS